MQHNEREDGPLHRAVADIQMRLILPVDAYAQAGMVMDTILDAMNEITRSRKGARFDFVGIQTHPCKDAQMARHAQRVVNVDDFMPPGTLAGTTDGPEEW